MHLINYSCFLFSICEIILAIVKKLKMNIYVSIKIEVNALN